MILSKAFFKRYEAFERIKGKRKNRKALEKQWWVGGKIFLKQVYCTSANCEWWSYDVIPMICASTLCWNKPYTG